MRKWHYCAVALVAAIVFVSGQGRSEYLFRKDGSIIQGKITGESAKNVTIRKADGKVERVERSDLMRILYTQLYMGKVYIRLTTGKVLDGYMVDEDQDTYTFRKDSLPPRRVHPSAQQGDVPGALEPDRSRREGRPALYRPEVEPSVRGAEIVQHLRARRVGEGVQGSGDFTKHELPDYRASQQHAV
jgi:hypothetical protein